MSYDAQQACPTVWGSRSVVSGEADILQITRKEKVDGSSNKFYEVARTVKKWQNFFLLNWVKLPVLPILPLRTICLSPLLISWLKLTSTENGLMCDCLHCEGRRYLHEISKQCSELHRTKGKGSRSLLSEFNGQLWPEHDWGSLTGVCYCCVIWTLSQKIFFKWGCC